MTDPIREPLMHTFIEDGLPDDDPRAFDTVWCTRCHDLVHASHNECMTEWVEAWDRDYCLRCWYETYEDRVGSGWYDGDASEWPPTRDAIAEARRMAGG